MTYMLTNVVHYLRTGDFTHLKGAVEQGLTYDDYRRCIGEPANIRDVGWAQLIKGQMELRNYAWLQVLSLEDRVRFILKYRPQEPGVIRYHAQLIQYELLLTKEPLVYLNQYVNYLYDNCPDFRPHVLYGSTDHFMPLNRLDMQYLGQSEIYTPQLLVLRQSLQRHLTNINQYEWVYFTEISDFISSILCEIDQTIKQTA